MRVFHCDQYVVPLPPVHRFPMEKYRLLHCCRAHLLMEIWTGEAELARNVAGLTTYRVELHAPE